MRFKIFNQGGYGSGGISQSGGSFNGPLVLSSDPTGPLQASTKNYVDNALNALNGVSLTTGTVPLTSLPAYTGDLTNTVGTGTFTLANSGVTPSTYPKITVDAKGRVTNGYLLAQTDLPALDWNKIASGKPTTMAGYGITDALSPNGGTMTGDLILTNAPSSALHVATKAYVDSLAGGSVIGIKTGDLVRKPVTSAAGFLRCNGGQVSKTTYSALYAVVGDAFNGAVAPGAGRPWQHQSQINTTQGSDITGWTTAPNSLPTGVSWSQAIVTKNRVYMAGGNLSPGGISNTVYSCPINADGTLGAWVTETNSLPAALMESQAIVTKGRVYLIGGMNGSNVPVATVYTAVINADGTLGTWTTAPSLPIATAIPVVFATKGRVYLMGGYLGSGYGYSSSVYYAPINSDGTLGTWVADAPFPVQISSTQAVVTKNRVYIVGGYTTTYSSAVYVAPITNDGAVGAWTLDNPLPVAICYTQVYTTSTKVYILGGTNVSTYTASVYIASLASDGSIGNWVAGTALPGVLGISQVFATYNHLYLFGGNTSSTITGAGYMATISGGLNDYTTYDGTITPADPTKFAVPDFSQREMPGSYTYIKY